MPGETAVSWIKKSDVEFIGHLRHEVRRPQPGRFALLLGAGASASSGIPVARKLVERWIVELHCHSFPSRPDPETPTEDEIASAVRWAQERHPEWALDIDALGASYSAVIATRHPAEDARQRTFHELCADRRPGFAYAAIALLMSGAYETPPKTEQRKDAFSVALTTNFDDLLTVASYWWGRRRPLVVSHDDLARFATTSTPDPLIVHLHGAYQTLLRNTEAELDSLRAPLSESVRRLLSDRDLIVIGYGGHDPGVTKILTSLADYRRTVWWVSRREPRPNPELSKWLSDRSCVWVTIDDFDSFAFDLAARLGISIPDEQHTTEYLRRVSDDWSRQGDKRGAPGPTRAALQDIDRSDHHTVYDVILAANAETDRKRADDIWHSALDDPRFNHDPRLLDSYAIYLASTHNKPDRAEEYFKRAIDAEPSHANSLGNYAFFLSSVRGDHDAAERLYERAIAANPNHSGHLGNFATFFTTVRKDYDRAQELFERAIDADPNDATSLGHFALFLSDKRGDVDRAEELYRRALIADPDHATNLGNFAAFLTTFRQHHDRAEALFSRAVDADPLSAHNLGNFATFLCTVREEYDKAERLYERAIAADPRNVDQLSNFARFLTEIRKDDKRAQALRDAAVEASPT